MQRLLSALFPAFTLLIFLLIDPVVSMAQDCTSRPQDPSASYAVSMVIRGTYTVDGIQGSANPPSYTRNDDKILVTVGGDSATRGEAYVDVNGYFTVTVFGDYSDFNKSLDITLCDFAGYRLRLIGMNRTNGSASFTPDVSLQDAPEWTLAGNYYRSSGDRGGLVVPFKHGSFDGPSMSIIGYVTVHGVASNDEHGELNAFYEGPHETTGEWGLWQVGLFNQPFQDPNDPNRKLYEIEISGLPEDSTFVFTQSALDPIELGPHFGIGIESYTFHAGTTIGSIDQPENIVLKHPPFLEPEIPGQVISAGESFEQVDLQSYVVDPTGQPIFFAISGEEHLDWTVDENNILTVTPEPGWTGADRVTIEATHATGELTLREADFVVTDPNSRYPDWESTEIPALGHWMNVVAALDEGSSTTLNDHPLVGAFIDGELRGISRGRRIGDEIYFLLSVVTSDPTDEVTFQMYEANGDQMASSPIILAFQSGATIGSQNNPVRLGAFSVGTESSSQIPQSVTISGVFPNPVTSSAIVRYSLDAPSPVTLLVVDMLGRENFLARLPLVGSGMHEERIDLKGLASGVYSILVETDRARAQRVVAVLRE